MPRAAARAAAALLPRGELTDKSAKSYWSAFLHADAPLLRTAVGNFTVLTSICRIQVNVDAGSERWVWVPWTESNLAAIASGSTAPLESGIDFVSYPQLSSLMPLSVRPLRLSFRLGCSTATIKRGGFVRVLSHDQLLNLAVNFPTNPNDPAIGKWNESWSPVMSSSPDAKTYTAEELADTHEFVSVPASYPRYNSYYDTVSVGQRSAWGPINGEQFQAILQATTPAMQPGGYVAGNYNISDSRFKGTLAEVPCMRGFLLYIKASSDAQTYELEIRRQDGARYAANTLGQAFAKPNTPCAAAQEDGLLSTIAHAAKSAADAVLPSALEAGAAMGMAAVKRGVSALLKL